MSIQSTLSKFEEKLDKIIESQKSIEIELNRQHHDLYGNGKKGLFEEFDDYKKSVDKHSKYFWGLGIISCFAGGVVTFIVNLISNKYLK